MPDHAHTPDSPSGQDRYWDDALAELADVDPELRLTLDPVLSAPDVDVFDMRCRSLGGVRIAGWLAVPKTSAPARSLPGLLVTPGYIVDPPVPLEWARRGFVALCVAHRGKVRADVDVNPGYPGLVVAGIEDPQQYIYRGIYADAVRAFDILAQHPAVDRARLGVRGVSQGGALALAVTALRAEQVKAAAIGCPFLTDVERGLGSATCGPYEEVTALLRVRPELRGQALASLKAVDTLSLAPRIQAPMYLHMGGLDRTCPPETTLAFRDAVASEVELDVFEDCDHEAGAYWAEGRAAAFLTERLGAAALDPALGGSPLPAVEVRAAERAAYFYRIAEESSKNRDQVEVARAEVRTSGRFRSWRIAFTAADGAPLRATLTIPDASPDGLLVLLPRYGSVNLVPDRSVFESVATFSMEHRGQVGAEGGRRWVYPGVFAESVHDPESFLYRHVLGDCLRSLDVLDRLEDAKDLPKVLVGDDLAIHVAAARPNFTAVRVDQPLFSGDTWQQRGSAAELGSLGPLEIHQAAWTMSLWDPAARATRVRVPVLLCLDEAPTPELVRLLEGLPHAEAYKRTHRDAIDTDNIWAWTKAALAGSSIRPTRMR